MPDEPIDKIRAAVKWAQAQGLKIRPGAFFRRGDFATITEPDSCCPLGACILQAGKLDEWNGNSNGFGPLTDLVGTEAHWLSGFYSGFDSHQYIDKLTEPHTSAFLAGWNLYEEIFRSGDPQA